MYQRITQIGKVTMQVLVILLVLDLMILFASIAQIANEGNTGHWNTFWSVQARFLVDAVETLEK